MDLPSMMKLGSYSDPFCVEYMNRTAPFNRASNHFHDYYEVYIMLSGKRVYFVKDTIYSIEAGDLVFIGKNEVHKPQYSGEPEHETIVFHFDDRFVRDEFKQHAGLLISPFQHQNPIVRLPQENREQLDGLINRMLAELYAKPDGYEIFLTQAIKDLLLMCSHYITTGSQLETEYVTPLHRKISDVVHCLNVSYGERVRIHDLSKRFFISPHYLSRIFKEVTGFTIIDYVNLTRIKEAQRLLRETDLSIIAIAARVGFVNFSHFGKMFKKITRTSARDYRKDIMKPL
jgi:AraC-like DNA-binding protein